MDHFGNKEHAMAKKDVNAAIGSLKEVLSGDDDFVRDAVQIGRASCRERV